MDFDAGNTQGIPPSVGSYVLHLVAWEKGRSNARSCTLGNGVPGAFMFGGAGGSISGRGVLVDFSGSGISRPSGIGHLIDIFWFR